MSSSALYPLPFSLSNECPVAFPPATSSMLEYPLVPVNNEEGTNEFVERCYVESLWLPDTIMPLSHLVIQLRRVPASLQRQSIRRHLLSLRAIEKKYQETLPALLADPRSTEKEEFTVEENAMWYAWHHACPPARHFPNLDDVDEERWKSIWIREGERREILVQILLHHFYLAAQSASSASRPSDPGEDDALSRKRKRQSLQTPSPVSAINGSKRGRRSRQKDRFAATTRRDDDDGEGDPEPNLDMLTDRVAIWQAVEDDSQKMLNRPGDKGRDWMRVFVEDVVAPLFKSQVPELVRQFERKIIPPSEARSRSPSSSSSSERERPKPVIPPSRKRKSLPVKKPTLTEADLVKPKPNPLKTTTSLSRTSTPTPRATTPTPTALTFARARSVSIEPEGDGRRSRSRSVSLAADELKFIGGKRGGIAGNSKLFASEVEMRKTVPSSSANPAGSVPVGGIKPPKEDPSVYSLNQPPAGVSLNETKPTTLVAATPERPTSKPSILLAGNSSDDEGVPESPEIKYLGRKSMKAVVQETPLKGKGMARKGR